MVVPGLLVVCPLLEPQERLHQDIKLLSNRKRAQSGRCDEGSMRLGKTGEKNTLSCILCVAS